MYVWCRSAGVCVDAVLLFSGGRRTGNVLFVVPKQANCCLDCCKISNTQCAGEFANALTCAGALLQGRPAQATDWLTAFAMFFADILCGLICLDCYCACENRKKLKLLYGIQEVSAALASLNLWTRITHLMVVRRENH